MKGDIKVPSPCIAQGVRQQKGASPIKASLQNLNIVNIDIDLKQYVPNDLKYYNQVFLNVLHEEIRSIN